MQHFQLQSFGPETLEKQHEENVWQLRLADRMASWSYPS